MNTAYVHVGMHKTASTSVQKHFKKQVLIKFNPQDLFKWNNREVQVVTDINDYEENVFFSFEQLSWFTENQAEDLLKSLKNKFEKVVVILMVRDPFKLSISHKNQSVKSLFPGSFLERELYGTSYSQFDIKENKYLNYDWHLSKWQSSDEIVIGDFDDLVSNNKLESFFYNTLGLIYDGSKFERDNESLSYPNYLFNTHVFNTESDFSIISKHLNFTNSNLYLCEKIKGNDEVVINKGSIALLNFMKKVSLKFNDINVDTLRDSAITLEKIDLNKAYELMLMAHKFRPSGKYIKKKLDEYKRKLGKE